MKLNHITQLLIMSVVFSMNFSACAKSSAGKTLVARGEVTALDPKLATSSKRKLKRRSEVFSNDVVNTGEKSKAQLHMADGGLIALKQNSELVISNYSFNQDGQKDNVVMELVKGGLRSVTGKIKTSNGDYNLKTPVGSIGIRGTHYEVELVSDKMFVAVWDGAVDVSLQVGEQAGELLSLGDGADYSFASIDAAGNVEQFIEPPENFNSGMTVETDESDEEQAESEEDNEGSEQESSGQDEEQSTTTSESEEDDSIAEASVSDDSTSVQVNEQTSDTSIDEDDSFIATDDFNSAEGDSVENLISDRSGAFTYNQLSMFSAESTSGGVKNPTLYMNIDFDSLGVTAGELTFEDNDGQWRASFSGNVNLDGNLSLDVSHASHGNNLADGDINASFLDGIDSILGGFQLEELLDKTQKASGNFILK